jgi:sulfofructose kinase
MHEQNSGRFNVKKQDTDSMEIEVLCVGMAVYDLVFAVDTHPAPNEKRFAHHFIECGGGPAANAAVTVAKLGYAAGFAGYLGNDLYGQKHFTEFTENNVHTSLIARGNKPTPVSVSIVKPNGDRSLVNYKGKKQPVKPADIDFSNISPKVVLFDGHEPLLSIFLAKQARAKGIRTILDAGSVHIGTQELVDQVDYLICSEKFAHDFTGEKKDNLAAGKLFRYAPHVIITLGKHGLYWMTANGSDYLPAFKTKVVDTTGAGDAFHGAFAVSLIQNKSWMESLRFSSAVAALCCTYLGGRCGIPTMEQVNHFLSTNR